MAKASLRPGFVLKLNDAEAEAAETQTWLEFGVKCNYLDKITGKEIYVVYDQIIGKLVSMIANPVPWLLPRRTKL